MLPSSVSPLLTCIPVVMVLGVYAMRNQSRIILYVLLFIFIAQVVVPIVWKVVYVRPWETRFKASGMVWAQSQVSTQS